MGGLGGYGGDALLSSDDMLVKFFTKLSGKVFELNSIVKRVQV